MVIVEIDSNYINAKPTKNKTGKEHINAYQELLCYIKLSRACNLKLHTQNNKASKEFQDEINKQCKMQMVPLDTHRWNIVKKTIKTFKNHYIVILAGVDLQCPISLWCKLIPSQAVLTLNLVQPSNVYPDISAYAFMHGHFNYNTMDIRPLGCAIQLYLKHHQ